MIVEIIVVEREVDQENQKRTNERQSISLHVLLELVCTAGVAFARLVRHIMR